MNDDNRRPRPFERSGPSGRSEGRDDHRHASQGALRPAPSFDARGDWSGHDRDEDSRHLHAGPGEDRFGGYTGGYSSHDDTRNSHSGSHSGYRANAWDEERFGYPESDGRDDRRGASGTGRSEPRRQSFDRFDEHRYAGSTQAGPSNFAPRRFGHEFGRGWSSAGSPDFRGPRLGPYDARGESSFTGGRDSWSGSGGSYRGYGIPSGNEPGGFGLNTSHRAVGDWDRGRSDSDEWSDGSRIRDGFGHGVRSAGGRPPKGYTRSDERIRDDVCEQLYRSHEVDVGEVSVEAKNGTIVLEGTVPDRRMKHRIEDLCEQCIGVNDVDNRIRVVRASQEPSSARSRHEGEPVDPRLGAPGTPAERAAPSAKKGAAASSSGSPH